MKLLKTLFASSITFYSLAQSTPTELTATRPPVYINFVSHNEPDDQLDQSGNYFAMKALVLQLADTINSRGAAWNLQTCAGFVQGAISNESLADNMFRTLANTTYIDNIEIDPRYKTNTFGTMADLYHALGALGANRTHTLGGFLAADTPDWYQYEAPQVSTSMFYPTETWQCEIMWGAASLNHNNDIDNWGIWKPDTESMFITHNPARNVWYIGNGCSPDGTDYTINMATGQPMNPGSFDATDNVSDITTPLKAFIDSIQMHEKPWLGFYNYSITINQSDFGPTLFSKIAQICDSVNSWGTDKIVWSKLTDRLVTFNTWSASTQIPYFQWDCGEVWPYAGVENPTSIEARIYPNPSNGLFQVELPEVVNGDINITNIYGQVIKTLDLHSQNFSIDLSNEAPGIYMIHLREGDRGSTYRFIKE